MDYEIIEEITHADIAVRVKGSSLDELFVKSGRALISEMVENPGDISFLIIKEGNLTGDSIELMYFEFLNEILFFKDAERVLLIPEIVKISDVSGSLNCDYRLCGEKIIRGKHNFKVDVKAVTMHGLRIYKENDLFVAEAVFDV